MDDIWPADIGDNDPIAMDLRHMVDQPLGSMLAHTFLISGKRQDYFSRKGSEVGEDAHTFDQHRATAFHIGGAPSP